MCEIFLSLIFDYMFEIQTEISTFVFSSCYLKCCVIDLQKKVSCSSNSSVFCIYVCIYNKIMPHFHIKAYKYKNWEKLS